MPEPGEVLYQRYQLKQKLSNNLGRQTWIAKNLESSSAESVIIKLLIFNPQVEWDDLKLFEREANTLQHLNHPYIPAYIDHFPFEDRVLWFGLVQTYIPGNSLKHLLQAGKKFTEVKIRNIAVNLLEILIYLHELSPAVLHRDIKPGNIILGQDNQVYLVDFGAVQARAAIEGATFTVVGTYGYTPIEQFGGRAVPASDLYALGSTLIHLLTGTSPADLPQQNMRIQFREHVSLSSDLLDWIEVLTHPSVDRRFQTAREALSALQDPQALKSRSLHLKKIPNHRIQLKKAPDQLGIQIPPRGIRSGDSLIVIWAVILYGASIPFGIVTFPFSIAYWLASLIPLGFLLCATFGRASLSFNQKNFVFEWKLFWIRYRKIEGFTATIQDVCESHKHQQNNNCKQLVIQAGHRQYQFGGTVAPISPAERQWLLEELKEWLGIE